MKMARKTCISRDKVNFRFNNTDWVVKRIFKKHKRDSYDLEHFYMNQFILSRPTKMLIGVINSKICSNPRSHQSRRGRKDKWASVGF